MLDANLLKSVLAIDGNPVVAMFLENDAPVIVGTKSKEWKACHVRQSQYFLHIVKCTDPKSSFQSSYLKAVPKRFLSPSLPVVHTLLPTFPCVRIFLCKMS